MESNFAFIKEIFPETYRHIVDAEKSIRVNQAIDVRLALESLIKERLKTAGIDDLFVKYGSKVGKPLKKQSLQEHIALCCDKNQLSEFGWSSAEPVLPAPRKRDYYPLVNGKRVQLDEYDFLRKYGNAKSHDSNGRNDFLKINYSTSLKALKKLHRILREICRNEYPSAVPSQGFMEDLMPIQGQEHLYYIDEGGVPLDAPMSRCQMEFNAHFKRSGSRTGMQYALIRQYDKKDVDTTFLLRNVDTVQKTQDEWIDILPPCMVRPVEISTIENQGSPFYIVAYHFQEKPHSLSNELLQSLDMKSRLFICGELTQCMVDLHKMGIYHRLLSHASVYVCDYSARGKGWRPHLVKFDFTKLVAKNEGDALATVKAQTKEAKEKIKDGSIRKYIPEDWDLENWEKVDVYSLGILFCDILSGAISPDYGSMIKAMQALRKSKEMPDGVLNVIGAMISRAVAKRPAMVDVQHSIQAEMESWN